MRKLDNREIKYNLEQGCSNGGSRAICGSMPQIVWLLSFSKFSLPLLFENKKFKKFKASVPTPQPPVILLIYFIMFSENESSKCLLLTILIIHSVQNFSSLAPGNSQNPIVTPLVSKLGQPKWD